MGLKRRGFSECENQVSPITLEQVTQNRSREAAEEYSPRRKPWVLSKTQPSPEGAKDMTQFLGETTRSLGTHFNP